MSAVPYGTRADFLLFPGLTSWAKLFRRFAARVWSFLVHRSPTKQVLTYT